MYPAADGLVILMGHVIRCMVVNAVGKAMRRREFITALGGAAAVWSARGQTQQAERMRRIGVLFATGSDDDDLAADTEARIAAFVQGLSAFDWVEGRNCRLDTHLPKPTGAEIRAHIAELIAAEPDVVLTTGGSTLVPFLQATRTIPIVFMSVVDPVGSGFIESLAHPGGNATGFMQFDYSLSGKWLELLKQVAPGTRRAAIVRDATTVSGIGQFAVIQSVAPSLGIDVVPINVRDAGEIESAIVSFARLPNGGLIAETGAAVRAHSSLVVTLAERYRLPAIFPRRSFVDHGGLMSYGFDVLASCRQAAGYVDRILKGEKPADLPVQAPAKYELVVNLKTAKTLGLTIPPTLLVRADGVIE
jgi:putative ABC transport system substrate-binding protein